MAVPSFNGVVFLGFHICGVESFEPLQGLKAAFIIPFYELLNWNGLNQDKEGMTKFIDYKINLCSKKGYPSFENITPTLEYRFLSFHSKEGI